MGSHALLYQTASSNQAALCSDYFTHQANSQPRLLNANTIFFFIFIFFGFGLQRDIALNWGEQVRPRWSPPVIFTDYKLILWSVQVPSGSGQHCLLLWFGSTGCWVLWNLLHSHHGREDSVGLILSILVTHQSEAVTWAQLTAGHLGTRDFWMEKWGVGFLRPHRTRCHWEWQLRIMLEMKALH